MIPFVLALFLAAPQEYLVHGRRPAAAGNSVVDWSSSMVWCQDFDNNLTDDCGSNNFTAGSASAYSATTMLYGTHSLAFSATANEPVSCANSTCTALSGLSGNFSAACWVRLRGNTTGYILNFGGVSGGEGGFAQQYSSTGTTPFMWMSDGTDAVSNSASYNPAINDTDWTHWVVTGDATSDEMVQYFDGAVDANSPSTQQDMAATSQDPFYIGGANSSVQVINAFVDQCVVDNIEWGPQTICRVCSCGWTGDDCVGSGTSYTNSGRNATECGSCTLPPANQAAPGTN